MSVIIDAIKPDVQLSIVEIVVWLSINFSIILFRLDCSIDMFLSQYITIRRSPIIQACVSCFVFMLTLVFALHYINFLLIFPLLGHKLRLYHMPVDAVRCLQFLRCSLLPGDTILKHHDMIGTINCAHPVRDNENCLILDQLGYGLLDYQFIVHIK